MYQQQTPQPRDERSWSGSEYEAGYAGNLEQSDQLADAIARRLQSQAPSNLQIPASIRFQQPPGFISAGMRLALAIVSIIALIPLSAIILAALGPFGGLLGLGVIGVVVLGINLAFNYHK